MLAPPDDAIHDMWNNLLISTPVWYHLIEIPGRASRDVMDPMLAYFLSLGRAIEDGFERDPLKFEESVPF